MTSKKLIAVAGVTGNTGSAAAETVLERGGRLRVLVRNAEKGQPWKARGAEVAITDLSKGDSVAKALEGADGAYLLGPPEMTEKNVLAARQVFIDAAAEGIRKSGIPHVVYLSSIAAQKDSGTGVILTANRTEKTLDELDTSLTFIRAGYFVENWLAALQPVTSDGVLPVMWSPADKKVPTVATRDIGRVAAEALLAGPKGKRHIIELAGPEDLSGEDVAKVFSDILGREIKVTPVSAESRADVFKSFGASDNAAELFSEMYGAIENGTVAYEGGDAEFVRGTTTAREVLAAALS